MGVIPLFLALAGVASPAAPCAPFQPSSTLFRVMNTKRTRKWRGVAVRYCVPRGRRRAEPEPPPYRIVLPILTLNDACKTSAFDTFVISVRNVVMFVVGNSIPLTMWKSYLCTRDEHRWSMFSSSMAQDPICRDLRLKMVDVFWDHRCFCVIIYIIFSSHTLL